MRNAFVFYFSSSLKEEIAAHQKDRLQHFRSGPCMHKEGGFRLDAEVEASPSMTLPEMFRVWPDQRGHTRESLGPTNGPAKPACCLLMCATSG